MAQKIREKIILCWRLKCVGAVYLEPQKRGIERDEQELRKGKYETK